MNSNRELEGKQMAGYAVWNIENADWQSVPDMAVWDKATAEQALAMDLDEQPDMLLEVRPYPGHNVP